MPTTGTNPILIRDSEVAFRFDDCKPSKTGPAYSTKKKARSETVVAMAPSCFDRPMASNYGLSQENGFLEGAHQLVDPINFRYLRHVVLKFVLSRENEVCHYFCYFSAYVCLCLGIVLFFEV
ncbi:unnamed protein product [Protopolystoma xenopodis]|uniref:Uncharacterized protein n=1 Tax=Protopolystoma xenopodis TaxID=117903 RepID=A0A3S5C2X2_9PLAT|nr:unnamed protein product [Protopolystoma xenopodis]